MRLRPSAPRSATTVRTAVRLMYAGAAVTTVSLIAAIISVAFVGRGAASLRVLGRGQPLSVAIPVGIVSGLVLIALWLWMAWANAQGRNWCADLVDGGRRPGDAPTVRRPRDRPGDVRRIDLADRHDRGVAALAADLEHVFQVAALHAGRTGA